MGRKAWPDSIVSAWIEYNITLKGLLECSPIDGVTNQLHLTYFNHQPLVNLTSDSKEGYQWNDLIKGFPSIYERKKGLMGSDYMQVSNLARTGQDFVQEAEN